MTGEHRAAHAQASRRRDWDGLRASGWLLALALLAGTALRAWILAGPLGVLDSDEAVFGLMALHVLRGEFSLFYWGQEYLGSLDAFLIAPLIAGFGPHTLTVKALPLMLAAASTALVWAVGRRLFGEATGRVAAALFWIWPPVFVWWSTVERAYWTTMVLGLVVLWMALRLADHTALSSMRYSEAVVAGLALGVGWWVSPQIVYLAGPAALWLALRRRRALIKAWVAVPAAILGSGPWLVFNFAKGWASLDPGPQPPGVGYFDRLVGFFSQSLPIALGFQLPFSATWLPPVLGPFAYLFMLGFFGWALLRRPPGTEPLLLGAAMYPFVFALSPFSAWVADARYLLYLSPFVALLVARALSVGFRWTLPPIGLAAAVLISATGLMMMEREGRTAPFAPDVPTSPEVGSVLRTLKEVGANRVLADYWVAYRLSYLSGEEVVASPTRGRIRSTEYERALRESPRPMYVLQGASSTVRTLEDGLAGLSIEYEKIFVDDFVLIWPEGRVLPTDLPGIWGEG